MGTGLAEVVQDFRLAFDAVRAQERSALEGAEKLRADGHLAEAQHRLESFVSAQPYSADAWAALGEVVLDCGEVGHALDAATRALSCDADAATAHALFGRLMREAPGSGAQSVYLSRMRGRSDASDGATSGHALVAAGDLSGAIAAYRRSAETRPSERLLRNLADVHALAGAPAESALWRGFAFYHAGEYAAAAESLRTAVDAGVGTANTYLALGDARARADQWAEAREALRQGARRYPHSVALSLRLAAALHAGGENTAARRELRRAVRQHPRSLTVRQSFELLVPAFYERASQIQTWRRRYRDGLARVAARTRLDTPAHREDAVSAVGAATAFYLGYRGGNVRAAQATRGRWAVRVMNAACPEWARRPVGAPWPHRPGPRGVCLRALRAAYGGVALFRLAASR
jgi:tetratricopeptide (TPR) repeat protein